MDEFERNKYCYEKVLDIMKILLDIKHTARETDDIDSWNKLLHEVVDKLCGN